jgi:deazaflavin-dependent oxidoreductase (nitroreductase family)
MNDDLKSLLSGLSKEAYCYLTTKGRKSGNPHEIEIWFCIHENSLYLLSGGRDKSDWVKNLLNDPHVTVRIGKRTFNGVARIVNDEKEDGMIRTMLADKYNERERDGSLSNWAQTALAVGIELGA